MPSSYDDQRRAEEGAGVGLIAGLVLVLAIIALIFLATRNELIQNGTIDLTPNNNPGVEIETDTTPTTVPGSTTI